MKTKIRPSSYHFFYVKWNDIGYDRNKCISFMEEYSKIKDKSVKKIYDEIIEKTGKSKIKNLLEGDYDTCRLAEIEKYSREAAIELLVLGQYTKTTFQIISNFPLEDYKLVLKRTKELYDIFTNIKIEVETTESKIPGM